MPGPAVHTIISEQLPREFNRRNRNSVARALKTNRAAMTYGAMGPDPFFFNINDLTPKGISLAKEMVAVWDFIGRIKHKLNNLFQPVQDVMIDVKAELNKGVDTLAANSPLVRKAKNLLVRLRETSRLFSNVMRGFVKKTVLDKTDPFGLYVSPYQTCESDHKTWWWFDTLHSRQTGDFSTRLLDIARGRAPGKDGAARQRDQLLSYAVGYLSHLAADVVGHAYVNTMVGGPYRLNQAQRHTTQEKIMDVRAYDYYYNTDGFLKTLNKRGDRYYQNPTLLNSGLHKNQQFTNGKYDPKQYQIDHDKLFQRPKQMDPIASGLELPSEISRNFSAAANQVYDTGEFGRLTPEEVDQSYRLWYLVLRNSTSTLNVVHPEDLPEIEPISEETKQQWEKFKNWFENHFNSSPGGGGGKCGTQGNVFQKTWDCVKTAAESVWNFVTNVAKAIAEFVTVLVGLVRYVVEDLLALPLETLNFLLQKMYEQLYASYRTLLLLLTSLGFGYCYNDQIEHGAIRHLWDPAHTDHFGRTVRDTIVKPGRPVSGYPREGLQKGADWHNVAKGTMDGLSQEGHLVIPFGTDTMENPPTIPGPDVYSESTPEVFITDPEDELDFKPEFIAYPPKNRWDTKEPSASTPPKRADYRPSPNPHEGRFANPVLGTAVQLTGELFERYLQGDFRCVPNLNMSGDRGIGYPNWVNEKKPRCSTTSRHRWTIRHGSSIDWLNTPIDARFHPDTSSHY